MSQPISNTHTPGPWIWTEEGYSLRPECPQPDTHDIHTILDLEMRGCGFAGSKLEDSLQEDKANHALIAAAPELLEALTIAEEFMRGFECDQAQTGMEIKLAIIRHALSKGTGQHE